MKKVGIFGAGVTGLSVARFLRDTFDVEILESKDVCGGIARTIDVDGIAYHVIGGHCFNSKYPEILDFVFNEVLPKEDWNEITRVSKIRLDGHEYAYPIEFSVKEIEKNNPILAHQITDDFLATKEDSVATNLADWFVQKFGKTLADTYFIPYNKKIWGREPAEMSALWVQDKLPIPDKKAFLDALNANVVDSMPHAKFFYPKTNNQNTFLDALAEGTKILYKTEVHSIVKDAQKEKWIVNSNKEYDIIINTTPIDKFIKLLSNVPEQVIVAADMLKYNKISNVLWKSVPTNKTWTYFPESHTPFHRYIHIGSYHRPSAGYSISESVGEHSKNELIDQGKKDPFLIEPLAYHISEHAYVVFDKNYQYAVSTIMDYLKDVGIYSIGRFGEWQYYNMDVCMKRSLDTAEVIKCLM